MNNIRTTLTGLSLAVLIAVQPLTTNEGFDLKKDWLQITIAGAIAIFGWLSKDAHNKPIE